MWGGSIKLKTPMLFAIGFIVLFSAGSARGDWLSGQRAGPRTRHKWPGLGSPQRLANGCSARTAGSKSPFGGGGVGPVNTRNTFLSPLKPAIAALARSGFVQSPIGLRRYSKSTTSEGMFKRPETFTSNTYGWNCSAPRMSATTRVAGETRKNLATYAGPKDNTLASTDEFIGGNEQANVVPSDLFERLVSKDSLKRAWIQLKSNPGMLTLGTTSQTLEGISEVWFEKASEALLAGTYKYPHRRRIHIPKPGREETRPLTISDPRVKIIERALLNGIEPYFEGVWAWSP